MVILSVITAAKGVDAPMPQLKQRQIDEPENNGLQKEQEVKEQKQSANHSESPNVEALLRANH